MRLAFVLALLSGCVCAFGQGPAPAAPVPDSTTTTITNTPSTPDASATHATVSAARPNSPAPQLVPAQLKARDKFNRFVHHTYAPSTYFDAAFDASYLQATGDMYELGGGMEGWGKRYGYMVANSQIKSFAKDFFFPTVLHQDSRYLPKRTGSVRSRLFYAATRVVVGRTDDGRSTFNGSEVLSVIACKSLYNAYYPQSERGFGRTGTRIASTLGSDAGDYVREEFWPELTRILYRHTPNRLRPIVQRFTRDETTAPITATKSTPQPAPQPTAPSAEQPTTQQ